MKFIDSASIEVKSGDGGQGHVSFRREKFMPKGGPDGGNGGRGGDIIIMANSNMATLLDFRYVRKYHAEDGAPGGKAKKTGKDGKSKRIKVPVGTQVYDADSGELLADIDDKNKKVVLLKGGKGGKGNAEFVTSTRQAPRFAQEGIPGELRNIKFELKLIADVGFVGMPNAGKSTLISVLSAAKPKIADYPFTTLVPNLGIVKVGDNDSYTVADIPGLIEGASDGKGLGFQFLKHVERTASLLYMLDINGDDLVKDYEMLRNELHSYSDQMKEKSFLVAITKFDSAIPESIEEAKNLKFDGVSPILISSVSGHNIEKLKSLLWESVQRVRAEREESDSGPDTEIPRI